MLRAYGYAKIHEDRWGGREQALGAALLSLHTYLIPHSNVIMWQTAEEE